jgi:hypothetical protein
MVGFPLLLIPLAIYNIVAWLMPSVSLTDPLVHVTLPSGADWPISLSGVLLALGILLLLLEIAKGAKPGSKYLTDHLLSFVVFAGAAAEFVLLPKFGTPTFFLLTLMTMVDFFGGIVLRAGRPPAPRAVRQAPVRTERPAPEPRIEPVPETPVPETLAPEAPAPATPAQPAPSAASVAESVLSDHPRPKPSPASETHQPVETTPPAAEPSPELPGTTSASSETPPR